MNKEEVIRYCLILIIIIFILIWQTFLEGDCLVFLWALQMHCIFVWRNITLIIISEVIIHRDNEIRTSKQQFYLTCMVCSINQIDHRHLLVGDPPPVCVSCQERLSVEHILIHCAEYIDIRVSCFNVNTVRELFDTVPPVLIISFIRRAGLLYLI